jgi:hypothetical protein
MSPIPYLIIRWPLGSKCHLYMWECNTFTAVGHNNWRLSATNIGTVWGRCQPFSIANDWNNWSISSDISTRCRSSPDLHHAVNMSYSDGGAWQCYPPLSGSHSELPLPPKLAVQCNFDHTDNMETTLNIIPSSHLALSYNSNGGGRDPA